MKILDWPPVWLLGSLAAVMMVDRLLPWGLFGSIGQWTGAVLIGVGVVLMGLAAAQMVRARTTVIPRRPPQALVTGGVFRISRNPIYLGDALVLAGVILWMDAPLALPVLGAFVLIIQRRFILAEEAGLRTGFGAAYDAWARRTRRWI